MSDWLLRLSGADRSVLADAPGDRVKYVRIGGTVLSTAVLALVSCTFTVRTGLGAPLLVALVAGVVWAAIILNLDGWLVASNSRQDRWYLNLLVAVPRIALAVVIGAVVSKPLVLSVFSPEVERELTVMHREEQAQFERDLASDARFVGLDAKRQQMARLQDELAAGVPAGAVLADPEIQDLTARLDAVSREHDAAEQAVTCEKEGQCGSGRVGAGPAFAEKLQRRDRLADERAQLQRRLEAQQVAVRAEAERQAGTRAADARSQLQALQQEVGDAERPA